MLGLGIMGGGMAANLQKAGFPLTVYNRTAARTQQFVAAGASVAATPAELAAGCDVVLVCVSDTPDVEAVLFGPDGVAAGAAAGTLVVDASTIAPAATRDFAARLADQGVALVDAPVSGGAEGAKNGTLSIMVGGSAPDVERARPVLEAIGRTITHVGPVGAGQTCKLVNQVLVVVNMLAVSEALLLAEAGGLDPGTAIEAVAGRCRRARGCSPTGVRRWSPGTGGPASPSTCSRRTCAWCWTLPTSSASRCWVPPRCSSSTGPCRPGAWAARATTRWSRPCTPWPEVASARSGEAAP